MTTTLRGANPESVDMSVTNVIETAVNSVPGIEHVQSSSSPGVSVVAITFSLEKNVDVAFNEIQAKINQALRRLPRDADAPVVAKDTPGFIVNLLLIPFLLDAIRALESGKATREDIDTGVKLGLNHPMGPLTLGDFVGLDTTLFVADAIYEELKDPRYAAPTLLRRMVMAGRLGRKSGAGFYDYR